MRYIDEGVFRQVYKISGCPLVVKFPLNDGSVVDGVQHSISEVNRIKRLSKIKELLPHLPKIHYFDRKNGVLVMRYYKSLEGSRAIEQLGRVIRKLVSRVARVAMSDIHADNIRQGIQGGVVFSDLGY